MATTILMLPPQTPRTRAWASRLREAVPGLVVVVVESEADAARAIGGADAAFGTLPDAMLARAGRLRWLQAPQAAPPAGYYTPALIAHPVTVTSFREIYNDLIGAHIMAFVLAFARASISTSRASCAGSGAQSEERRAASCTCRTRRR